MGNGMGSRGRGNRDQGTQGLGTKGLRDLGTRDTLLLFRVPKAGSRLGPSRPRPQPRGFPGTHLSTRRLRKKAEFCQDGRDAYLRG